MKMEEVVRTETSAYKIQMSGNYPEETYDVQNKAKKLRHIFKFYLY